MKQNKNLIIQIIAALIFCLFLTSTASARSKVRKNNVFEASQRIEYIQKKLDMGTKNAQRWQYTWTSLFGVSTAYNGISVLGTISPKDEDEADENFDYKVNAIKSGLAFGSLIAKPLTAYSAAETLRNIPEETFNQKLKKMRVAEKLLKKCADREKAGRSLKEHVLAISINLLAGIAIASDDHRTEDALISAVSGIIASEIRIFTTPTRAIDDWDEYHRLFYYDGNYSRRKPEKENRLFVSAIPFGLQCTYLF